MRTPAAPAISARPDRAGGNTGFGSPLQAVPAGGSAPASRWLYGLLSSLLLLAILMPGLTAEGKAATPAPATATASPTAAPKAMARVYGEFEDLDLWKAAVGADPSMANWTDQEAWDGLSGATIQQKSLSTEVGDRTVYLGDAQAALKPDTQILAYSDGFGQFWFKIEPGTWTITGTCPGYESQTRTFTVRAGEKLYLNFWLKRK